MGFSKKIVVKFGGSNLKTAQDVRRSAAVAAAYGRPLVVVVSAFSGVTDDIIKALDGVVFSMDAVEELLLKIRTLHAQAVEQHIPPGTLRTSTSEVLEKRLAALERLFKGIHYIGAVPDFTRDMALSFGERLSSPIVAAVLQHSGLDAVEALPEDIGLETDGRFGNAGADLRRCTETLPRALGGQRTYVVPGFYGVAGEGKVAVFGRGGSDYTAAVIARCIGAESLDLWKDVDGFLSCDPRIASDSRTIPYLSYAEAAELSYFGAKVLHPRTVEPLEDEAIPIRVMNVEKFCGPVEPYSIVGPALPEAESTAGTATGSADGIVSLGNTRCGTPVQAYMPHVVKSVASSDDAAILRLEGPGVGSRPGILARVTGRLDAAGVNISSVITAQTCINLLFKRADLPRALAVLKAEALGGIMSVEGLEDTAIVAAVGSGIRDSLGVASQVLGSLREAKIPVVLAQAGASPVAIYVLVRRKDREAAVRAIHSTTEQADA